MKVDIRDIHQKWFADDAPQNFKRPSASIGAGADGTITIERDIYGVDADGYEVAVVAPVTASALNAELAVKKLTVTLEKIVAAKANATIGSGTDGTVTIEVDTAGAAGNAYTVEVINGETYAAVLTESALVITVREAGDSAESIANLINSEVGDTFTATASGTGATTLTEPEAEKSFSGGVTAKLGNTATEIANAISTVDGFTATASGTGATAITESTAKDVAFEEGQFGTPCPKIGIGLQASDYYYISTKADNTQYNDGWRRFTLADY